MCHDAGMCVYKEDSKRGPRWGAKAATSYRPLFWADMDVFVYFSHGFVTLPPRGWVHAAHTNGVPILGTIIVEWEVRPGTVWCAARVSFLTDRTVESLHPCLPLPRFQITSWPCCFVSQCAAVVSRFVSPSLCVCVRVCVSARTCARRAPR